MFDLFLGGTHADFLLNGHLSPAVHHPDAISVHLHLLTKSKPCGLSAGLQSTSNNKPSCDRRRRRQWTGVGLTSGARQRDNQPDKRHERSGMRDGGAIRGRGAPVDGRRQHVMKEDATTSRTRLTREAVGNKSSSSCSYLGNNQQKRKGAKTRLLS